MSKSTKTTTKTTRKARKPKQTRTQSVWAIKSDGSAQVIKPSKKNRRKLEVLTHANGHSFTRTRPGVQAVMLEVLTNATAAKPATKQEILDTLVKRFPEREELKMRATVNLMVPSGFRIYNKVTVEKNGHGGYWVPKSK